MPKHAITTPRGKAIGPYSLGISIGDFVFVSGQIPLDAATGKLVEGDVSAQARQSLENVKAVLKDAKKAEKAADDKIDELEKSIDELKRKRRQVERLLARFGFQAPTRAPASPRA